jgi:DNA-binding response OmpR family regulator
MDILLVEDHGGCRTVISKILANSGHHVIPAGSVEEALSLIDCLRFDALVSDIVLPDGSGLELVTEAKRKQPIRKSVALTGLMRPEDRERGLKAGFDDYLTKPVDFYHLCSLLP